MEVGRLGDDLREIPRHGGMRVPARVWASEAMMRGLRDDPSLEQLVDVAHLPGIVGHALATPDVHSGCGFPIGGVAATDAEEAVVTPGGIGFHIDCGVRLPRTRIEADAAAQARRGADAPHAAVPSGAGSEGAVPALSPRDRTRVPGAGPPGPWPRGSARRATSRRRRTAGGSARPTPTPSPLEAKKDAAAREAIPATLEHALAQGPQRVIGNSGFQRFLRVERGAAAIDREAVARDARLDVALDGQRSRLRTDVRGSAFDAFAAAGVRPPAVLTHCGEAPAALRAPDAAVL